jgi:bifunctional DNA-binding transcriptional regulator/antitoxin component of YhaV-PrlF toxin-antitoxin module
MWENRLAMRTKLSTDGRVVLPPQFLKQLGLRPGAVLDVKLGSSNIVLTPKRGRRQKARIVIDPITGLHVLTAGPGAPVLTSEQVREMLADFP